MVKGRDDETKKKPQPRPATTPEAMERRVVAKAYTLAEKQIDSETASAQVITHFLKMGSSREFLEQERIQMENRLTEVKMEALASEQRTGELVEKALKAFISYTGQEPAADVDPYEE